MTVARFSRLILTRSGLVAFGLLLALVLLEIALRTAALFTAVEQPVRISQSGSIKQRVACLGDSNTYGLFVDRERAYPKVLEYKWNREGTRPIEVFNLGVPGTNSSKLLSQFRRLLDTFAPHLALVMIGANDFWTVPVPLTADGATGDDQRYELWRASRVFRLLFMVWRSLQQSDPLSIEFQVASQGGHRGVVHYGEEAIDLTFTGKASGMMTAEWQRDLQRNLEALLAIGSASGTRVVLLTYPADFARCYQRTNEVIRRTAAASYTPLIDIGQQFHAACPDETCTELLLPDCHPNYKGHALVAAKVRDFLQGAPQAAAPVP
jgi:lysophospholipase L1-like esterase